MAAIRTEAASRFVNFVNKSPTPFHAVHNASLRLEDAGFVKIKETDDWDVQPGGKYYFTRNQSSLLAFTVPPKWKQGNGVSIVATHVDSPNLKVRPVSKRTSNGYLQLGVETYGGGIWHSWFDRDLSLAGRVIVSNRKNEYHSKLIKIDKPILRIPTLAIHLDRNSASDFKFNTETEFVPILGLIQAQLNEETTDTDSEAGAPSTTSNIAANHSPALLSLIAREASVDVQAIHDFELSLFDTQPSTLGGLNDELIFSSRMDNLVSSFCAVEALAESSIEEAKSNAFPDLVNNINAIALFNHEEIGSVSTSGAKSTLIPFLLQRLSPTPATHAQTIARSFLISADMGHAAHPNYPSKHEVNHKPVMNGGIVIKTNANQRYASDAIGSFIIRKLVERKGGKVQEYEVRNDMACGSTVGPMLSKLGLRTVDVGNAMLSMHSCRETAGSHDVQYAIDLFNSLFEGFAEVDSSLHLD